MKARIILIVLAAISTFNFISAFSAQAGVIGKKITISDFHKLTVENNINIILTTGNQAGVSIEGRPEEIESVNVKQQGDELVISRGRSSLSQEPITVYVVTKDLTDLIVENTANVKCDDVLHAEMLSVLHTGTGSVILKSDASIVRTVSSNHGRIVIEGNYANMVSHLDCDNRMLVVYSKEKSAL